MQENVRLKYCDLSWNGFTGIGAMELALAISENFSLKELRIRNNKIGSRPVGQPYMISDPIVSEAAFQITCGEAFGRGLVTNANQDGQLELIDLSGNPLKAGALLTLLTCIAKADSTKLKSLGLQATKYI
ncbi:unnamed protein product [Protopolystoma xenopodis]|uniref:Uncharacterized protein n=1 Tax=Protopolystoma xenopodis TaxID=117903 RepID=A0A448X3Z9_9PLAT|nr:unnamed protein product [Protopolystoma xenopodis]